MAASMTRHHWTSPCFMVILGITWPLTVTVAVGDAVSPGAAWLMRLGCSLNNCIRTTFSLILGLVGVPPPRERIEASYPPAFMSVTISAPAMPFNS